MLPQGTPTEMGRIHSNASMQVASTCIKPVFDRDHNVEVASVRPVFHGGIVRNRRPRPCSVLGLECICVTSETRTVLASSTIACRFDSCRIAKANQFPRRDSIPFASAFEKNRKPDGSRTTHHRQCDEFIWIDQKSTLLSHGGFFSDASTNALAPR